MANDDRQVRRPPRRARGSLSGDEILDAAQRIVEDRGLAELSMPVVAKELNSGVTSIYWYFRNKDDLLQALTDRAARQHFRGLPPVGDGSWDYEFVEYFAAYRELLDRVPVYREILTFRTRFAFSRSIVARAMIRRLEAGLELLVEAGLTPDVAAQVYMSCAQYTNGFVILEHGYRSTVADDGDGTSVGADRGTPAVRRGQQLDDAQFRFGLNLIVDGICAEYGLWRGHRPRHMLPTGRGRTR